MAEQFRRQRRHGDFSLSDEFYWAALGFISALAKRAMQAMRASPHWRPENSPGRAPDTLGTISLAIVGAGPDQAQARVA